MSSDSQTQPQNESRNFYFDNDTEALSFGTPRQRFDDNVAAIRLSKQLDEEGRVASPLDQLTLLSYTGWGNREVLKFAFELAGDDADDDAINAVMPTAALAALNLSETELAGLKHSTANAHFTALPVVRAIWSGLAWLGICDLPSVRLLDPSAGIGHFVSAMPAALRERVECVEIELDPLTAHILQQLHPESRVLGGVGFEQVALPENYFDVVLTNVPFSDVRVNDARLDEDALKACLHDYFIARAVQLVRPGGVVAVISSRYSLDKQNSAVRAWLRRQADLLLALRLPDTAFKVNAGTEVVTDVLFLRKRFAHEDDASAADWTNVTWQELPFARSERHQRATINEVYATHPEWMLGTPVMDHGLYGVEFVLRSDGCDLRTAMTQVMHDVLPEGRLRDLIPVERTPAQVAVPGAPPLLFDLDSAMPHESCERLTALKTIYEAAKQLIALEMSGAAGDDCDRTRVELNAAYDNALWRFGPLHGARTLRLLKDHPVLPFLLSLEKRFDARLGTAEKADLFWRCTVRASGSLTLLPSSDPTQRAKDALLVSLDRFGRVNLPFIAQLIGMSEDDAAMQLVGLIFRAPSGEWQMADEYLSGDLRVKLREAEAAATLDPAFTLNVTALQAALPTPLKPGEIAARLGSGWVPEDVLADFIRHLIPVGDLTVSYVAGLGLWAVNADGQMKHSIEATQRWGAGEMDALDLIHDGLSGRTPIVYNEVDGKRVTDPAQTTSAQAKLGEIKAEFEQWLWRDAERAARLAAIYNETYNTMRVRRFNGAHLTLPGLNTDIALWSQQKDAIWRIICSQAALIGHEVGLGKTLDMICAVIELKRLGVVHKAMVVVPNHLTGQWLDAVVWAYPGANVLCAGDHDLAKAKRGAFLSCVATGNWDLVIVPMSSFKLLPVSYATSEWLVKRELSELEEHLWRLKSADTSVAAALRAIEKAKSHLEALLRDLGQMRKDHPQTITFEELGVDMLCVDESHLAKNLWFNTKMQRVAGLPNAYSERAWDMFVKTQWLLERGGRVVFATGTPLTNSLAEAYTLMRYLERPLLKKLRILHFDAWAQMFGEIVSGVEMTPDGSGFRVNQRFARFTNLPELVTYVCQFLDVRTASEVNLPRPKLHQGRMLPIRVPASAAQRAHTRELSQRVDAIRARQVDAKIDNMLRVTGDGRKAAVDIRLVKPHLPDEPHSKINTLARWLVQLYHAASAYRGVQMVFLDLATPKASNGDATIWQKMERGDDAEGGDDLADEACIGGDLYADLKRKLILGGIPVNEIAFIHDARNRKERDALFAAAREGDVRILIGSTDKMGAGTNAQKRLVCLYHVDPTWRPDGITQRNGRILRPGNDYPEVFIFQLLTEPSFDGYYWQLLEVKGGFIHQFMTAQLTERAAEDIGDFVLTAAQFKAIASGNPLIRQKIALDTEFIKLKQMNAVWLQNRHALQWQIEILPGRIAALEKTIAILQHAIACRDGQARDEFSLTLKRSIGNAAMLTFDKAHTPDETRERAGRHLALLAEECAQRARKSASAVSVNAGCYRGAEVVIKAMAHDTLAPQLLLRFGDGEPCELEANFGATGNGTTRSLDYALDHIEGRIAKLGEELGYARRQHEQGALELERDWEHEERLAGVRRELARVVARLQERRTALDVEEVVVDSSEIGDSVAIDDGDCALIVQRVRALSEALARGVAIQVEATDSCSLECTLISEPAALSDDVSEGRLVAIEAELERNAERLIFGQMPRVNGAQRGSRKRRNSTAEQIGLF